MSGADRAGGRGIHFVAAAFPILRVGKEESDLSAGSQETISNAAGDGVKEEIVDEARGSKTPNPLCLMGRVAKAHA
jgi:hypothetical protein